VAVRHPLFARLYVPLSRLMERELGRHRRALLAGLEGRVVEIGAGNGLNFRHYPATVDEVVALEPEPHLRTKAEDAARSAPVSVTVSDAMAEQLPLEDGSFDAAVSCLVLCSVSDPARALSELRRLVRSGGELRFLEHMRSEHERSARMQQRLDRWRIWPAVGGGCHCSRDTLASIRAAGFTVEELHSFDLGGSWVPTNPHVLGTARAA
jgi:ubiquinone/menaquinone biosynthesis C-methylase UbiE